MLDIYGRPFEREEDAKNIYRVTKKEYGTAGPAYIEKLIKEYSSNNYEDLMKEYDEIEEILNKKCSKGTISSYVQAMASIVLADSIIGRYFFETNLESSIEMGLKILDTLPKEDETSDVERACNVIESWILQNDLKFDKHTINDNFIKPTNKRQDDEIITNRKEGDTSEKYGLHEGDYYYILPNKFNELMEQNHLSSLAVKKQLAELGYIKTQRDRNRTYYEVLKFYNGGRRRMIAFRLESNNILPDEELEELEMLDEDIVSHYDFSGSAKLDI